MSAFFPFELEPPPWLYRLLVRLGFMRRLYRRLAADLVADTPRHGLLVDVGAGTGGLLALVAPQRPDLRLLALDHAPAMFRTSRLYTEPSPGGLRLWRLVGDAGALPLTAACADLALATFSFHTWTQPAQGLREMRRIVKPGGRIYIYEMKREASLEQLRALAQEEALPFFLVAAGFKLLSGQHALRAADFAASFAQAGISRWELQSVHHFLWRAVC
ncbi:MAG: class I SAM-dependent methyltransferase [Desulfobacca sp.]|uniref:class I SAM-dependent methyltransferase n=1 Tax=Desulfobacca sp. TaxID=2067990 RepID=UPI00404B37CF